jgi:PAS domain S-box-containing protein
MESGPLQVLDASLYRRGHFITALARWVSVGLALLSLAFVWDSPRIQPRAALAVGLSYAAFNLLSQAWLQRRRARRLARVAHDLVDALAVGLGAVFSGGLQSPIWLLLYPHVVSVAVRGGLGYALAMGTADAVIVAVLARVSDQPLGNLHSLTLLFCAFMGGTTSSHLHRIQERLASANAELGTANRQLSETVAAQVAGQRQQDLSLARLQESEERYRRLLGRIQDGVIIIQSGRLVYANEVFAQMVGDPDGAFLGHDFLDLVETEDRSDIADRYRAWEESRGVSGSLETHVRTRDGRQLLVVVRAGGVELQGKRSVIATVRDITVQRRMEQEVRQHAERLAALNEIANAVNLSLTIEDIFAVAADETRRLVPCDLITIALLSEGAVEVVAVGEGRGRRRTGLHPDELAWAFAGARRWCRSSGEKAPPHSGQLLDAAPAGSTPELAALATLPLRSKDRVIGSLNLGRRDARAFTAADLETVAPVARHIAIALGNARLLEDVRRRGDELETLLEIGRNIVERLDLGELLPLVARSVNRVMGTSHCLLLLRSQDDMLVAAQEGLEPEVIESFKGLKVGDSLSGWVLKEGKLLSVPDMREDPRLRFAEMVTRYDYRSFLGVPLRHARETLGTLEVVTKGEPRRFSPEEQALMTAFAHQVAVAIDNARLFEQARAHLQQVVESNRRLEELDRLRREYLRNISHEFRTPLTVIRGYAEFLLESHPEGSLHEVMKVLVESSDRVIDLVDTLIDVSRIEQGQDNSILNVRRLDLRELAEGSVETLRFTAARKKVQVELDFPAGDCKLEGDGSLLHQVVKKLVDNAVKYSPPGGRVMVRARPAEEEMQLEVEDRGIGIAAEHLPRIFEKFYMVDGSIARRVGGTGVGLYLVREIVRLHHGSVEVKSLPGEGSTFSVRLPRQFAPRPQALA